jgi:hypothetical protein
MIIELVNILINMLEISLTSVGDVNSRVSRFVKRKRADLNILKVTKNEFIHAFLRSSSYG